MEETTRLNLDAVSKKKIIENDVLNYKSPLGDFSWTQERLIEFGKGKYLAILFFVHAALSVLSIVMAVQALGVDMTITTGVQPQNLNWLKIFYVLTIGVSLINPFIYGSIFFGAKKKNLKMMERGIAWLKAFTWIGLVLLVVGAVIFVIFLLTVIFRAFLIAVVVGAIGGFFFWIYFKFLTMVIDVLDDIIKGLHTRKTFSRNRVPDAIGLRPYLYGFLVLQLFGLIPSSDGAVDTGNSALNAVMTNLDIFSGLQSFVSLGISIVIIIMVDKFDVHMRKRPPGAYIEPQLVTEEVITPRVRQKSIFKD